jgi:hypothetical protein
VAEDEVVLDLVRSGPRPGMQPNILLAAGHDLVLRGVDHPLATLYAGEPSDVEVGPAFCDLIRSHGDEVRWYLEHRRTNTNECGRAAVLVPALRWVAATIGEPVVLLDGGASAGLNLHLDRYRLDYGDAGVTGPADATVRIECAVTGDAPIEAMAPEIAGRIGLDRAPVDLANDDDVRWQLACVWPDTGRLERTREAIELARRSPVEVVRGDLIEDLASAAARLPSGLPLCVMTSWVMAYVPGRERPRFVEALAALSRERRVAWIVAEGPGIVRELPAPPANPSEELVPSVLGVVQFAGRAGGGRRVGHVPPPRVGVDLDRAYAAVKHQV